MAKVRRLRQRYHNLTKGSSSGNEKRGTGAKLNEGIGNVTASSSCEQPLSTSVIDQLFPTDVLSTAKVTSQLLKNQFADFEERNTIMSTLSAKSSVYAGMKKKTKKELRHQLWLKKVNGLEQAVAEARERKNRQKTAVVGDVRTMVDALPDLTSFLNATSRRAAGDSKRMSGKYKPMKKESVRALQVAQNAAIMTAVMNDPDYQANPFQAIQTHLKLKFGQPEPEAAPSL